MTPASEDTWHLLTRSGDLPTPMVKERTPRLVELPLEGSEITLGDGRSLETSRLWENI